MKEGRNPEYPEKTPDDRDEGTKLSDRDREESYREKPHTKTKTNRDKKKTERQRDLCRSKGH